MRGVWLLGLRAWIVLFWLIYRVSVCMRILYESYE
jgi:hypothetical protein